MHDTPTATQPRTVTATFTRTYGGVFVAEKGAPLECPECSGEIKYSVNQLDGNVRLMVDEQGVYYGDQGTEMDWDSAEQLTGELDGYDYPVLMCSDGHLFIHLDVEDVAKGTSLTDRRSPGTQRDPRGIP